jgi:hypothetical protein
MDEPSLLRKIELQAKFIGIIVDSVSVSGSRYSKIHS